MKKVPLHLLCFNSDSQTLANLSPPCGVNSVPLRCPSRMAGAAWLASAHRLPGAIAVAWLGWDIPVTLVTALGKGQSLALCNVLRQRCFQESAQQSDEPKCDLEWGGGSLGDPVGCWLMAWAAQELWGCWAKLLVIASELWSLVSGNWRSQVWSLPQSPADGDVTECISKPDVFNPASKS